MTRWALPLLALLLACSPPSEGDGAGDRSPPTEPQARPVAPRAPKPAREPTAAPRKAKQTLEAESGGYRYVDESGHVRFAASLDAVPERQRSTAGHISVAVTPPAAVVRPTRKMSPSELLASESRRDGTPEVVLYTTESCPYCKRAMAYLHQVGQPYVEKDIESDDDAREEFLKLSQGRGGVPLIVVGDRWMQGWNQAKLAEMLADSR
jgi:glutaredoxin